MWSRTLTTLCLLGLAALTFAQDPDGELTKVKEQELEEVRERISRLKQSMDDAAEERDRLTGELQELDVAISEQRRDLVQIGIEAETKRVSERAHAPDQGIAKMLH